MGDDDYLQLFVRETSFYNSIVLSIILPEDVRAAIPHLLQTWLRNYIGGVILYLASGGLWAFYIYYWKRNLYLPKEGGPYLDDCGYIEIRPDPVVVTDKMSK